MSAQKQKTASNAAHFISPADVGVDTSKAKPFAQEFALWVHALRLNQRQGTVGCKGRADVSLSNKKPWKQKGTGRARAGTARSPLWRGGGVIFGPQERTRTLKVTKKIKKGVLEALLADYLENKRILILDWAPAERPKTADAAKALQSIGINKDKIVLFLPVHDSISAASFANLPNVKLVSFDEANALDLAKAKHWVVLAKDLNLFKEMVAKWS